MDENWRIVPWLVAEQVCRLLPVAAKAASLHSDHTGRVYAHTETGELSLVPGEDPPPSASWLLVKRAHTEFLKPVADVYTTAQKALGGPNPLAATIAGGALAGGLGYGAGALAERFLPQRHFERGKLRRTGALAGAALGAAPGIAWGIANQQAPEETGGWFGAWTSPAPFQQKASRFEGLDPFRGIELPEWIKRANAGAFYVPSIPVDAMGNAVWADVKSAPSPWGTKNPYQDADQPMGTPAPVAAAASGLLAGTAAATGRRRVSPWELGVTAATSAGAGYLAGMAFGGLMGGLAGLKPDAQEALKRTGAWGGLVTGAVNALFN